VTIFLSYGSSSSATTVAAGEGADGATVGGRATVGALTDGARILGAATVGGTTDIGAGGGAATLGALDGATLAGSGICVGARTDAGGRGAALGTTPEKGLGPDPTAEAECPGARVGAIVGARGLTVRTVPAGEAGAIVGAGGVAARRTVVVSVTVVTTTSSPGFGENGGRAAVFIG
jgi:hypothetical protein